MKNKPEIEIWFDFGSNYSYLSVMRIEELSKTAGCQVAWRPFLLGPIFKSIGWETSPFILQKLKGEHMWIDMVRQCKKYNLPWAKPTVFPRKAVLPLRVVAFAVDTSWVAEFCRIIMLKNFAEDEDISDPLVIESVLEQIGLCGSEIIQKSLEPENKLKLRHFTETAQELGIFGGPTFFVGNEMFWGNDRLEDAIEFACQLK